MEEGAVNETVMLSDVAQDVNYVDVPALAEDSQHSDEFTEAAYVDEVGQPGVHDLLITDSSGSVVDEQVITEEVLDDGHTGLMMSTVEEIVSDTENEVIMMDSEDAVMGTCTNIMFLGLLHIFVLKTYDTFFLFM